MPYTYTDVNPAAEVTAMRKQRAEEAEFFAFLTTIDDRQASILQSVPAPDKATAEKNKTQASERANEARAKAAELATLYGSPVDISAQKTEWLSSRIPQLEAEHARHVELRDNAAVYDVDPEEHALAVTQIEAAIQATREAMV